MAKSGSTLTDKPIYESLSYTPSLQTTNDLEPGTKTITATSESATPDYSAALTLAAPTDARLVVLRIPARLSVTIDSLNAGCAHVYCRVYADIDNNATYRLFDLNFTTAANQLSVVDTTSASLAAIFAKLSDGAAHTFYFHFWVDAGNAVLSVVQLWEGSGVVATGQPNAFLQILHTGTMSIQFHIIRIGSSNGAVRIWMGKYTGLSWENSPIAIFVAINQIFSDSQFAINDLIVKDGVTLAGYSGGSPDLVYLQIIQVVLRSDT